MGHAQICLERLARGCYRHSNSNDSSGQEGECRNAKAGVQAMQLRLTSHEFAMPLGLGCQGRQRFLEHQLEFMLAATYRQPPFRQWPAAPATRERRHTPRSCLRIRTCLPLWSFLWWQGGSRQLYSLATPAKGTPPIQQ